MVSMTTSLDAPGRPMTKAEAEGCITSMKTHSAEIGKHKRERRKLLFDLESGCGYMALGFDSIEACVKAHVGIEPCYCRHLLALTRLENRLEKYFSGGFPLLFEAHLDAINRYPEELQVRILQATIDRLKGERMNVPAITAAAAELGIAPASRKPKSIWMKVKEVEWDGDHGEFRIIAEAASKQFKARISLESVMRAVPERTRRRYLDRLSDERCVDTEPPDSPGSIDLLFSNYPANPGNSADLFDKGDPFSDELQSASCGVF